MSLLIEVSNDEANLIEEALLGVADNAYAAYMRYSELGANEVAEAHYERQQKVRLAALRIKEAREKRNR